jgi:hypothetical protein
MMPLSLKNCLTSANLWLTAAITGLFFVAFYVQAKLLWPYDHVPGISLLFLPHGIRVLAVLIGRGASIPGLLFGNLAVSWFLFGGLGMAEIWAGVLSSVMPFLALRCIEGVLGQSLTDRFNPTRLLAFVVCSAAFNAISHILLFSMLADGDALPGLDALMVMLTGDVAGGLLLIGVLWVVIKGTRDLVLPTALGRSAPPAMTAYALIERTGVVAGGLFLAYQIPFLVDPLLIGSATALGIVPFLVALVSVWQYRYSALAGLFMGALTLAPDYVMEPSAMLGFAIAYAVSSGLALFLVDRVWGLDLSPTPWSLVRFSLLLILAFSSTTSVFLAYGQFNDGTGLFWSQMVLAALLVWVCLFWPALWLFGRVRQIL